MASIKAVYRSGAVYIRAIHNRKTKYKKLFSLNKSYWSGYEVKRSAPNSAVLNAAIASAVNQYYNKAYRLDMDGVDYDVSDLFSKSDKTIKTMSGAVQDYVNKVKNKGLYKSVRKYQNLKDKIILFGDRPLNDFDIQAVEDFQTFLLSLPAINSKETVKRYIKMIKTVVRNDPNADKSIIQFSPVSGSVPREKLTREEFNTIMDFDNDNLNLSKDLFCALVLSWGARVGDMLQMQINNVRGDQLVYKEQKTGKDKVVKINPDMKNIIDRYAGASAWYLFPILTMAPGDPKTDIRYQKHIEAKTATVNKDLKLIAAYCGINKRLTTHVARHTFASWAIKKGVDTNLIQSLLNHSEFRTTEQYIKDLNRQDDLDDAAGRVLD